LERQPGKAKVRHLLREAALGCEDGFDFSLPGDSP
jgi:hypothetical protein